MELADLMRWWKVGGSTPSSGDERESGGGIESSNDDELPGPGDRKIR